VLFALSLKLTFRLYISTSLVGPIRGLRMVGLLEEFQVTVEWDPMPWIVINLHWPVADCCLILDKLQKNYRAIYVIRTG